METLITKDLVKFLAKLGKIHLSDEQVENYVQDLNEIVNYVTMVGQMPTKNIKPKFHTTDNVNVFQKTDANSTNPNALTQDLTLQNAKKTKNGMFVVPRIITK